MAQGRRQATWLAVSNILALIHNVNRDPKKTKAAKPEDYNPFSRHKRWDEVYEMPAGEGIGLAAKALGAKVVKSIPGKRIPAPRIPGFNCEPDLVVTGRN